MKRKTYSKNSFLGLVYKIWNLIKSLEKKVYLVLLFSIGLFVYLIVFALPEIANQNLLFSYYKDLYEYFLKKPLIPILYLIGLTVIAYKTIYLKSKKIRTRKVFPIVFILFLIGVGIHLALVVALISAIVQLNYFSHRINSNPAAANIYWEADKIAEKIKKMDSPPKIIESDKSDLSKNLIKLDVDSYKTSEFYKRNIINSVPANLIITINLPSQKMVLADNHLFILEIEKDSLQKISPELGHLLVKDYFKPRLIKSYPNISILGRQEYLKSREIQINKSLEQIDIVISYVDDLLGEFSGDISNAKSNIAAYQDGVDSSISSRDNAYDYCINAGYYLYGYFFRTFNQSYCDSQKSRSDSIIAGYQKNISDWSEDLSYYQSEYSTYTNIRKKLSAYRTIVASQKDNTPQELGVFYNESDIDIALDWTNSKSIYSFLATLEHEYLHYASHVSDERNLPPFFEEGLTEYYARDITKKYFGKEINLGYPLTVKLIGAMIKNLPTEEIQNIYFTKDEVSLQVLLDKTYEKGFYEKNKYNFAIIPYLSSDEALKLANEIMNKIRGEELNEDDLKSTDYFQSP